MDAETPGFDLAAAWSRRAGTDIRAFAEALATRLEAALPGRVAIERRRDGLFSATSHVSRLAVSFDGCLFTLAMEHGHWAAKRAKVVRGVTIGSEDVSVPAWLDDLVRRTQALGEGAGAAHAALQDFLLS
ncbi:MAG: hypothetical protein ACRYGP_23295 [Janthinobacterium lividum]